MTNNTEDKGNGYKEDVEAVAGILRSKGIGRDIPDDTLKPAIQAVLAAYEEHILNEVVPDDKEMNGYIIDRLIDEEKVYGVTHDLLEKIAQLQEDFLEEKGL